MHKTKHIWKLSLIYLAAGIFLLHAFIPHTHEVGTAEEAYLSCENNDLCIISILGSILEHNFGEEHLEHFQVNGSSFDDMTMDEILIPMLVFEFKDPGFHAPRVYIYNDPLIAEPDVGLHLYRGPPFYS